MNTVSALVSEFPGQFQGLNVVKTLGMFARRDVGAWQFNGELALKTGLLLKINLNVMFIV
jgi:hypothetical protein